MSFEYWSLVYLSLGVLAIGAALYGLHRLGLYLEKRGYIYYWHTSAQGGSTGVLSPLQEMIQPQIKHVVQVSDERWLDEEDAAGDGPMAKMRTRPGAGPSTRSGAAVDSE